MTDLERMLQQAIVDQIEEELVKMLEETNDTEVVNEILHVNTSSRKEPLRRRL